MTKSAAIVGVVNAVLAGLLAFGVELTEAQTVAIVGIVNTFLIAFAAFKDPKVPFGNVSIGQSGE